MRVLLTSAALIVSAIPALADNTSGTVLAFDRVAHVLVLDDKTVWNLPPDLILPEDLVAGDPITIDFDGAGENGYGAINSITRN